MTERIRVAGIVKFFDNTRNFGFILGEDNKDYFIHGSDLEQGQNLCEDDAVIFTAGRNDKGFFATEVGMA